LGRICITFGWIIQILAYLIGILFVIFNQFACVKAYEVEGLSAIGIAFLKFLVACIVVTAFYQLGAWLKGKGKTIKPKTRNK
jgi:hypothetical protein